MAGSVRRWIWLGFCFGVGFWAAAVLVIYAVGLAEVVAEVMIGIKF